jgi:hypothetical protein
LSGILLVFIAASSEFASKIAANAFSGKGFCLLFDRLQKVRREVQGYRKYP